MYTTTVQKTFTDSSTGESLLYTFTATGETAEQSETTACVYASMVEYGYVADKWAPKDMAFPEEQLYQFIQPAQLDAFKAMYPDIVATSYMSAKAYIQSYFGNMFDVDTILATEDTTTAGLTLRLALLISTVTYVLAASPQYAETIEVHNRQLHDLLRGLKSGQRNMGKGGTISTPDVRVSVVKLSDTGAKP